MKRSLKRYISFIVSFAVILSSISIGIFGPVSGYQVKAEEPVEELLTGTVFSNAEGAATSAYAFDRDTSTDFTATVNNGYVGIDLGEGNAKRVTRIRFFSSGNEAQPWLKDRTSGTYEGSNDGINYTELASASASENYGQWYELPVTNENAYRYLRFMGNQWFTAQLAEIEFYGVPGTPPIDPPDDPPIDPPDGLPTLEDPPVLPDNPNRIGINVEGISDWSVAQHFADVVKQSRIWGSINAPWDGTVPMDENGWPLTDGGNVYIVGKSNIGGTYKLSFTGSCESITTPATNARVENKAYDAETNTTTADIVLNAAGDQLMISFSGTKRLPADAVNTGLTNLKIIRPGYTENDTFTIPFLNLMNKFQVLRFMDWTRTNSNQTVNWEDRTLPTYSTQAERRFGTVYGNPAAAGVAWEYAIQLCNELNKDAWICVPHKATDDYVLQLAQLWKTNLEPGLKLYVEYSNEVWNTGYGFSQGNENQQIAVAEVSAGGSPLNYDGDSDTWRWARRRVAEKTRNISDIFRSVFGDSEIMTRVRPILGAQLGYDIHLRDGLQFLENYYGNNEYVEDPHPVSYYIYGCGGTAYYGPSDTSSVDAVMASMPDEGWTNALAVDYNWALAYGIKRIAYEGGPGMDRTNNSAIDTVKNAAVNDPRMKQEIIDAHNIWSQYGGELLTYYQSSGDYQWGFTSDINNLNTPKLQGINALNQTQKSDVILGTEVDAGTAASINAGRFGIQNGWTAPGDADVPFGPGSMYSYSVRVLTDGTYVIYAALGTAANGRVQVYVDGQAAAVWDIAATGGATTWSYSPKASVALTAGMHSIRLVCKEGTFKLRSVVAADPSLDELPLPDGGGQEPVPVPEVTAYRAENPADIDGSLNESFWSIGTDISKAINGTPDNTARVGAAWDQTYLYIGVEVKDANLQGDSVNLWDDDSVEIYVDVANNKGTRYDSIDQQIVIRYSDSTLWASNGMTTGMLHAVGTSDDGYNIELAIPWANYSITPDSSTTIGLDIGINDDDDGTGRESQLMWAGTGDNWQSTEKFGQCRLSDETAGGEGDILAPVITLDQTGGTAEKAIYTVSGSVNEACTLTVNGIAVTVGEDLRFTTTVNLNEGVNTIIAEATDAAKNTGTASITVTYQAIPADQTLSLVLDRSIVTEGGELNVAVKALGVNDLRGFDLTFSYNASLYELISVELSSQFGDENDTAGFGEELGEGEIRLLAALLGDISRNGDVELINIKLQARSDIDAYAEVRLAAGSDLSVNANQLYTLEADIVKAVPIADPDITGDNDGVFINDVVAVAGSFMASTGDENYDARLDMNKDGIIDIVDIAFIVRRILDI